METSRLSPKGQVTIPKAVRETLQLNPGDLVGYCVENGVVTLRRAELFDAAFHEALSDTLNEWASPEDDEAFGDL